MGNYTVFLYKKRNFEHALDYKSVFRKSRLYSQLMNRLDQHAQIMAQDFAEHLIELPNIALAAYRIPKLPLDHAKRRFDVRPLVIMR